MSESSSSSAVMFVLVCRAAGFHSHKTFLGDDGIPDGYELATSQSKLFWFFAANLVSWLLLAYDVSDSPSANSIKICLGIHSQRP